MNATQKDISLLMQHNKKVRAKVTLLDNNYVAIDTLTGNIVPPVSYDINADSDIRRVSSLTLSVTNVEQMEYDFENTWNRRMIEIALGVFDYDTQDFIWYNLGRMLISNVSTSITTTSLQINLNLIDLMGSLTQERGNQIGTPIKIPAGSSVKNSIEEIIAVYGEFKFTNVCEFEDVVPYDLTTDVGVYPIDVLKTILDLFPYYEMFYNIDGVFTVQKIPTKIEDPVDIDESIIDQVIISESKSIDFAQVKNTTEIWGAEISGDYFSSSCTQSSGTYNVQISESFSVLESGATFTIVPNANSVTNQKMKIQDTATCPIVTADSGGTTYTPIPAGTLQKDRGYVVRYFENKFVYVGELLIRCIVQEITSDPPAAAKQAYMVDNACRNVKWIINPDSPYACRVEAGSIVGEKRQVLNDGEFSKIYDIALALERATYENWTKCRLTDSVSIEMVLVPWMDVNDKISYTSPVDGEVVTWLVRGISYNLDNWTMTVSASRFYPYYPWEE